MPSVNAADLERAVLDQIRVILADAPWCTRLNARAGLPDDHPGEWRDLFGTTWDLLPVNERARLLDSLLAKIDYDGGTTLGLTFNPAGIRQLADECTTGEAPSGEAVKNA